MLEYDIIPNELSDIVITARTVLCGYGECGEVFGISDDYVVKIFYKTSSRIESSKKHLLNECDVHTGLYRAGLQVPKPEGIFEVRLEGKIKRMFKADFADGMVSQRIYGADFYVLNDEQIKLALHQQKEQIKRAKALGFLPIDHDLNWLFDTEQSKLYLLDFHMWKKKR